MWHDPIVITMQAREMVMQHGDRAEMVAKEKMFDYMQQGDMNAAGLWMAIVQEVRKMLRSPSGIN